jgi:hypothetical protein
MQLVEIGRNEPCPRGSGKKYKKCCLAARDAAIAGGENALDVAALVDAAIETDDWGDIHEMLDRAMEVFEQGGPLEHVRFRDDLIDVRDPDAVDFPKLCSPGWSGRCELEIAHVLAHVELEPDLREALRMAAHLVRRFGAMSPLVEELADLQIDELISRRRRLANLLSMRGLGLPEIKEAWHDIVTWLARTRPPMLSFADWFALRLAREDMVETMWQSGIARRVCDVCLDRAERTIGDDARSWAALGGLSLVGGISLIGKFIAEETPIREPTDDERAVYDTIQRKDYGELVERVYGIVRATESRGDYAGAALLRETMRYVQHWRR